MYPKIAAMHANENHETLSINSTIKVNNRRNNELIRHDSKANGRLLIFDINTGLKHETRRFIHPAPKFAHLAFDDDSPADSNIRTE